MAEQNIQQFVDAIGEENACRLFLELGGTVVKLPKKTGHTSLLAKAIGQEKSDRLAKELGAGHLRIPVARQWCARYLHGKGLSLAEIARRVRVKDDTVRDWCGPSPLSSQLSFFDAG